jgi:hypothetical protein
VAVVAVPVVLMLVMMSAVAGCDHDPGRGVRHDCASCEGDQGAEDDDDAEGFHTGSVE